MFLFLRLFLLLFCVVLDLTLDLPLDMLLDLLLDFAGAQPHSFLLDLLLDLLLHLVSDFPFLVCDATGIIPFTPFFPFASVGSFLESYLKSSLDFSESDSCDLKIEGGFI